MHLNYPYIYISSFFLPSVYIITSISSHLLSHLHFGPWPSDPLFSTIIFRKLAILFPHSHLITLAYKLLEGFFACEHKYKSRLQQKYPKWTFNTFFTIISGVGFQHFATTGTTGTAAVATTMATFTYQHINLNY